MAASEAKKDKHAPVFALDSPLRKLFDSPTRYWTYVKPDIEAHTSSAVDLGFIEDASVDFILACGLLCSMAPQGHGPAVSEMQRVLKPEGKAFLLVGTGRISYVGDAEWETILEQFDV